VDHEELIDRVGRALAAAAPPRSRIILFGSHARGEADRGSDLDLLVIEPEVERQSVEIARLRRALRGLGVPVDLIVVSEELARRRAKVPGTMIDRALREGRELART
jgi:predicted nucleotidyltransferase